MTTDTRFRWPDPAEAVANEAKIRERLTREVARYEEQFGIPSAEVGQRVRCGMLAESEEVCDWLLALDALEFLAGDR